MKYDEVERKLGLVAFVLDLSDLLTNPMASRERSPSARPFRPVG